MSECAVVKSECVWVSSALTTACVGGGSIVCGWACRGYGCSVRIGWGESEGRSKLTLHGARHHPSARRVGAPVAWSGGGTVTAKLTVFVLARAKVVAPAKRLVVPEERRAIGVRATAVGVVVLLRVSGVFPVLVLVCFRIIFVCTCCSVSIQHDHLQSILQ